jgi:hypothetical protein
MRLVCRTIAQRLTRIARRKQPEASLRGPLAGEGCAEGAVLLASRMQPEASLRGPPAREGYAVGARG